jgi:hypothetical protein
MVKACCIEITSFTINDGKPCQIAQQEMGF